jgi:hypothetical protein
MLSALKTAVGFFLVPIVLMLLFRNIEITFMFSYEDFYCIWELDAKSCTVLRIYIFYEI